MKKKELIRPNKKRRRKQKQLDYDPERRTLIENGNGIRTMNIASHNPDSTKEAPMQRDAIKNLTRNKIHLSVTPETHITQGRNRLLDNYRGIDAAAKKVKTDVIQGGTAIMIHGIAHQYITQATRHISRVLRVALGRKNSNMPIQILTTYAPHNGHTEEDRKQHWKEVKEILNEKCKRHIIIWCAVPNGQMGR